MLDSSSALIPARVNWRPGALSPYESLYSVLSKLVALNGMSRGELVTLTGYEYNGLSSPDLRQWGRVKRERLAGLLHISVEECDSMVCERYLGPSGPRSVSELTSATLRFCEQCMSETGYHTPVFQFHWMSECPRHRARLIDRCPACGRPLPYLLFYEKAWNPFICLRCGHTLWTGTEALWAAPTPDCTSPFDSLVHWLDRASLRYARTVSWLSFFCGPLSDSGPTREELEKLPSYWAALDESAGMPAGPEVHPLLHVVSKCGAGGLGSPTTTPQPAQRQLNEGDEAWVRVAGDAYWNTFRALSRHIRRRLLRRHRQEIRQSQRRRGWDEDPDLCPAVKSFRRWQEYWQGDATTWRHAKKSAFLAQHETDIQMLVTLLEQKTGFGTQNASGVLSWLAMHVFGMVFMDSYETCIVDSVSQERPRAFATQSGLKDTTVRFYAVSDEVGDLAVHSWLGVAGRSQLW